MKKTIKTKIRKKAKIKKNDKKKYLKTVNLEKEIRDSTLIILGEMQNQLLSKNNEKIQSLIENIENEANQIHISSLKQQIETLNQHIAIKDQQLMEQLTLIHILVEKLFTVNKGLEFLENRAESVLTLNGRLKNIETINTSDNINKINCNNVCNENETIKLKLEDCKACLENSLNSGNAMQVKKLEKAFKGFVKHKISLEKKCKCFEKQVKSLLEENESYKCECNSLRNDVVTLESGKQSLEKTLEESTRELESLKETLTSAKCRIENLTKENRCRLDEVVKLNDENRSLSKTIDSIKRSFEVSSKVTVEEVNNLTKKIDELNETLYERKEQNEFMEKEYQNQVNELNATICHLNCEIEKLNEKNDTVDSKVCKICRGKSKVGFMTCSEVQVNLNEGDGVKQNLFTQNKEEIIKVQNETISMMEQELEKNRMSTCELRCALERKTLEVESLTHKISHMEDTLNSSDTRARNLQAAVDLYLDSISVLETSEKQTKIENYQQKQTISNLQQALVAVKQELDEVRRRSDENVQEKNKTITILESILKSTKEAQNSFKEKFKIVTEDFDHVQDLNFNLEIEYCNSLQDVDCLENHLNKYQVLYKYKEDEIHIYKQKMAKLLKQKQRNEEIIRFFKEEMTLMAQQLCKLQEMLTCSNDSVQEEYVKIMHKFNEVQCSNEKLCTKLNASEQQCQLEQQMNQLNESKVNKLQQIIKEKDMELQKTQHTVHSIREQLQNSMDTNEELQVTVNHLNQTICHLKCEVERYEDENCKNVESTQECRSQISSCFQHLTEIKELLDQKSQELAALEMDYNNQHRLLIATQNKLQCFKDKEQEKHNLLKHTLEDLREKLDLTEANHTKLCEDYKKIQEQLAAVSRREAVKDLEVKRYRKIVGDLKKTLMELNKNLSNKEIQNKCKNKDCRKNMELKDSGKIQDICLNCPCEIEFYQSMVDNLKQAIKELQSKVTNLQATNKQLEKENEELVRKSFEDSKCLEMANRLRRDLEETQQQLQIKTLQLNDVKKSSQEINSSKCVQLACAQEEVSQMSKEIHRLMKRECELNCENDRLQAETDRLQSTIRTLEDKSQLLKGQLEHYLAELHHLRSEKETLLRKNRELINDLRSLQCSYGSMNKQTRCTTESAKVLESELEDLKNNKDDICYESKNVIAYVRAWLQEQRKINDHIAKKEKDYCDTIERLKHQNKEMQSTPKSGKRVCIVTSTPYRDDQGPPMCNSPWSLGSQGNASLHDLESPVHSPCPNNDDCDWYSPTFRNESDESEDEWVNKLENLTCQVRKSNRMWQKESKSREKKAQTPDYDGCRERCKK